MIKTKNILTAYSYWILSSWILIFALRVFETVALQYHHYMFYLFENELLGICIDVVFMSTIMAIFFPAYYLLYRLNTRIANIFTGTFLGLFSIAHISITNFFVETSKPLGGMLMEHTFEEVFFTIRTSGVNFFTIAIVFIFIILLIFFSWFFLKKIRIRKSISYAISVFSVLSILFSFFIHNSFKKVEQERPPYSIRINKSYYFYKNIYSILRYPYYISNEPISFSTHNELFPSKHFVSDEYPLLSETNFDDVLGAFLNPTDDEQLPNIVLIIVEGLGSRFLPTFHGLNLMPFLDSLSNESLYWDKGLTVGERSFSAVPSLIASSPHGKRGFTFENENLLSFSLINLLSQYDYYSTFFYGQPKWFHNKGPYLSRNGLDKFVESWDFPKKYSRIMVDDYFWGHNDQDLATFALEIINDSLPKSPRIDMYFTGSMHPPFRIDNEELYQQRLQELVSQTQIDKQTRKYIDTYKKYILSVMFTDDALRILFDGYKQQPAYRNTIFIITGDHPMSNIPIENSFKRYRVPIIIFSPLQNQVKKFHSVNSHLDITPTLLAYLHHNYHIRIPNQNAFIGKIMDTATHFRNLQPVVFMNDERLLSDILYENFFLTNEKTLFAVFENDEIERLNNTELKRKMYDMLQVYRKIDAHCCKNNKLIPDTLYQCFFTRND